MTTRSAGIITVGDELLSGCTLDRHSAWLSAQLHECGYEVRWHLSVGDAPGALCRALRGLPDPPAILLLCGGLGPTEDDRTRSEIAAALGVALEFRADAWGRIEAYFAGLGRRPVAENRRQAFFPRGAVELPNRFGTAPAFRVSPGPEQHWWILPGVPHEMQGLFRESVLPVLLAELPPPPRCPHQEAHFFGVSESVLAAWLFEVLPPGAAERCQVYCGDGDLRLLVPMDAMTGALQSLAQLARSRFGPRVVGTGMGRLPARLVREATAAGLWLAVAESCTGGLVGARLTGEAGASACFRGGWVVYHDALKHEALGVESSLLAAHGAVSAATATALARGAAARAGVQLAVGVTGIAGPAGGSIEKPVGTVFLGVHAAGQERWQRLTLRGDRERIRSLAANHALFALLQALRDDWTPEWQPGSGA